MENIVILDCGSQFTQLIARRVREMKVHSVVLPWDAELERITALKPKGLIISGGPDSVNAPDAIDVDHGVFYLNTPVLGICYGMQLITRDLDGVVTSGEHAEYGVTPIQLTADADSGLFGKLPDKLNVLMSHGDRVTELPEGFKATALTEFGVTAAMEDLDRRIFGLQFHPEVAHTEHGSDILERFLFDICECKGDWNLDDWVESAIQDIRECVGDGKVICGLSGGVDSSVSAALVHRAIGDRLTCIFVDHGLMRLNEAKQVLESYRDLGLKVIHVDASDLFLEKLAGVTDPEQKRHIIGGLFIDVFDREAAKLGGADWLLQGTIYPDVIESGHKKGAALIKSHHNVGGLPENMKLKLLEPLRDLFKDEVRIIGRIINVPANIVDRQPFPGPGLGVRCLGAITRERLDTLRAADAIFTEELKRADLYSGIWQSFCVLLPVRTVGVVGDSRVYSEVIALRAIHSRDAMTAEWSHIPPEVLDVTAKRICNEVRGVSRVVLDVTSKPPATIEWE